MDAERLADLTRNGEVLMTHPDLPDAEPAAFQAESVTVWEARGWVRYGTPKFIGEAGPELFVPETEGVKLPRRKAKDE